ncbi:zf-CCHC_4 domain-containing protein [Raphanus sativus]|nr:zf-CCHC_4 domain-containing protein [Raphanus sativus]
MNTITRPSSSKIFETRRLDFGDRSPIRSLSEDMIHVSLRLGHIRAEGEEEDDSSFDLQLQNALSTKAAGKRPVEKSQGARRTAGNPKLGANVKRRRVTKSHSSARRKLMIDAITTGGR